MAAAARRRLAALNVDVERQPSRLRIETIDAFNAWLAGRLQAAKTQDEAKAIVKAAQGLKINLDRDITIEFTPPK